MMRRGRARNGNRGQWLLEYVVLIGSVAVAVVLVASYAYKAFVANAQNIEANQVVF